MIPDGYYNVCELDEEAFRRLDAKLRLHYPTGRMQLRPGNVQGNNNEIVIAGSGAATAAKKRLVLNSGLTKLLGFSRETFEPGKTYTADDPHKTSHPSGDLRASCPGQYVGEPPQRSPRHTAEIYPRRERKVHGGVGGRTEKFPVLQYKRLAAGLGWGVGQRHSPSCSTNGWHRGLFPS